MVKQIKKITLTLLMVTVVGVGPALAQSAANTGATTGPKKQMATIIFSGLAGAVLGLSTLSFYERPQDKLSNIAMGFAIGIIAGASYTTYKAATQPYDYLDSKFINQDRLNFEFDPGTSIQYSWNF